MEVLYVVLSTVIAGSGGYVLGVRRAAHVVARMDKDELASFVSRVRNVGQRGA